MDLAKINDIQNHFSKTQLKDTKKDENNTMYTIRAKDLVSLYTHELKKLESLIRLHPNFTEAERKAALNHISDFFKGECKL